MIVEIITTGEEVLSGQITDTNAAWLSRFLGANGLPVARRCTVGDRMEDLVSCLRERARQADAVIVNGGLGPTGDDLSAEAAAIALGQPLVSFAAWVEVLTARFAAMNRLMPPGNLKQALLPQSARIIDNPVGTACGFEIELEGAVLYFTPGVPSELKVMMRDAVLPLLKQRFAVSSHSLLKRFQSFGVSESRLNSLLQPIELPPGISLGFRASMPLLEVKVMGIGEDEAGLRERLEHVSAEVRTTMGEYLVVEDGTGLEAFIQEKMIAGGHTLALAESCTGGMVAAQLIDIAGSSDYLERGFVTYSNRAKCEMLGVSPSLIAERGAVSLEVAREMALGAARAAGCSHALAISGVAGPAGGTPEKPVGTVALALAVPGQVHSQVVLLPQWGRNTIRRMAATAALDMLRRYLTGLAVFGHYDLARTLITDVTARTGG